MVNSHVELCIYLRLHLILLFSFIADIATCTILANALSKVKSEKFLTGDL